MPDNITEHKILLKNVFINCPFDTDYNKYFEAIIFSIVSCGLNPICAREENDSGTVRIDKICNMIQRSKYSIHDLGTEKFRLNMPFELGLFLGARRFSENKDRPILIIADKQYDYQKVISDIAGQDIEAYDAKIENLITIIATWLLEKKAKRRIDTTDKISNILEKYNKFDIDVKSARNKNKLGRVPYKTLLAIAEKHKAK